VCRRAVDTHTSTVLVRLGALCVKLWGGKVQSSAIVAALEQAWAAIRHRHPQIPPAVIVVAGSSTGNPGRSHGLVLGHFAALRWQHHHQRLSEVLISGEGLNRPATDVLATLLHEATHALAFTRGIKDTSRQGRWHNHRFATLATQLGLAVSKHPQLGWSSTALRPETAHAYTPVLANLTTALTAYRHREPTQTISGGNHGSSKPSTVAAACDCPRRIRVASSVLAQGPIICGVCDNEFAPT
jgi:hypothetical protein